MPIQNGKSKMKKLAVLTFCLIPKLVLGNVTIQQVSYHIVFKDESELQVIVADLREQVEKNNPLRKIVAGTVFIIPPEVLLNIMDEDFAEWKALSEGVIIQKDCFIGPRVTFLNDKYAPTHGAWRTEERDTVVEEGVSIGGGAVILPGVVLGKGCRIGAGAVVTRDVPPGMTVVGNPARNFLYAHPKWEE